jgi:hypothetical protein
MSEHDAIAEVTDQAERSEYTRDRTNAFEAFISFLAGRKQQFDGQAMLDELMRMLGPSLELYEDASRFVFAYARKQGYHIASYPYDPTSELRSFLAEYEVDNVQGWYARIGIDAATYPALPQRRLLVVRDAQYRRKAFLMSIADRITDDEQCRLVSRVIQFLGEDEHRDPTVF